MKACLDCGDLFYGTRQVSRCSTCARIHESRRVKNNPGRRNYDKRAYRNIKPKGQCQAQGCQEPATTKDHIVPVSAGGTNDRWNIQFLCATHNLQKSNKPPCIIEGCLGPQTVRGLCKKHYGHHHRKGTLDDVGLPHKKEWRRP